MATVYPDHLTVADALQAYFSRYHFPNGGYHLKWFKIKVGPVYIPFPNTKDRVAAVKIHDIHHLLTEYTATLGGEAEIGGWEIASGCGKYYMAWMLNFGSFFYGLFFFPQRLFKAFMRGRRCRTNLYHDTVYDEHLLKRTVGELRQYVEVGAPGRNTFVDYLYFILYTLFVLMCAVLFFCFIYLIAGVLIALALQQ